MTNVEYILSLRDNFSPKLAKIQANMKATGERMQAFGAKMSLAATLPLTIASGAAVKLASDFEETQGKFNVVFSSLQEKANETASNFQKNFGLSGLAARQLLSNTGDLLTGFGFSQDAAFSLSTQVNELAADLASFSNFEGGTKGASEALTKALLGEAESAKSLGIVIQQNTKEFRQQVEAQMAATGQTALQAKAIVILRQATEQSKNAIGDFARTQDSFANQTRITKARLEDLAVQIGTILMPLAKKLMAVVKSMIDWFSGLNEGTKRTILMIAGMVAAIGPLLIVLGLLAKAFAAVSAVMLANPIGILVVGIVAAVAGIALLAKSLVDLHKKTSKMEEITTRYNKALGQEKAQMTVLFELAKKENLSKEARKKVIDELNNTYGQYLPKLLSEKSSLSEIAKAQDRANTALMASVRAKQKLSELTAVEEKILEAEKHAFDLFRESGGAKIIESEMFEALKNIPFLLRKASESEQAKTGKKHLINTAAFSELGALMDTLGIKQKEQRQKVGQAVLALQGAQLDATKSRNAINRFFGNDSSLSGLAQSGAQGLANAAAQGEAAARMAAAQAGITSITSAAPKVFQITIGNLVETVNNNVQNMREGIAETKNIMAEALLEMLADVQATGGR